LANACVLSPIQSQTCVHSSSLSLIYLRSLLLVLVIVNDFAKINNKSDVY